MALIRAMNSAISGMRSQQFRIDVVGNNLANSTTTGYKTTRVNFHTLLSQIIRYGTGPTGQLGGINPIQLGLGVNVAETIKDFSQGELEATGVTSDLGIEGDGFFILKDVFGNTVFTRDGSFLLNQNNNLVNPATGEIVQGINADLTTFTIASGAVLTDLRIPVGELQIAIATSKPYYAGNLNGGGQQALQASVLESPVLKDGVAGPVATSGTLLTNLAMEPVTGGSDIDLGLNIGDTILLQAEKGGRRLSTKIFRVDTAPQPSDDGFGTTVGDFMEFLQRALGINPGDTALLISAIRDTDNDPNTPGVTGVASTFIYDAQGNIIGVTQTGVDFQAEGVEVGDILRFNTGIGAGQISRVTGVVTSSISFNPLPSTLPYPNVGDTFSVHEPPRVSIGLSPSDPGRIRIAGNVGSANDLSNIRLATSNGTSLFSFIKRQEASGESALSTATYFDSLGNPHLVELTFVLETKGGTDPGTNSPANTFRFFAESDVNRALSGTAVIGTDRVIGTGTVTFSTSGQFLYQNPDVSITLNIPNLGAATPLQVSPEFSGLTGFANEVSQVYLKEQDGFPMGTMIDYSIGKDGIVTGIFSNGLSRTVAQIMLARFMNPNGLKVLQANNYATNTNSGEPIYGKPGTIGIGSVRSGVLEASNVDFGKEFTSLIIGQRAFQANARVIRVADDVLRDLIQIM
jgi:flagellar hook protein FlgE